jgi:hypothetical protein
MLLHVMVCNAMTRNLIRECALPAAALLGLPPRKSPFHCWLFKYRELCPVKGSNPTAFDGYIKVVAVLMAELIRLDASREVKEGSGTDLLHFWTIGYNFGQVSRLHNVADRSSNENVAAKSFTLYEKS